MTKTNRPNVPDLLEPTIFAPKAVIKKWLAALRSGKYKKGTDKLYKPYNETYCCLGVLQECLTGSNPRGGQGLPSKSFLKKFGIKFLEDGKTSNDPDLFEKREPSLERGGWYGRIATASVVNDEVAPNRKKGFKWIADLIERRAQYTD